MTEKGSCLWQEILAPQKVSPASPLEGFSSGSSRRKMLFRLVRTAEVKDFAKKALHLYVTPMLPDYHPLT